MSHKENWLDKQFDFDFPISRYIEFIRFLSETPSKLDALVEVVPKEVLIRRDGDSWSIQENAGHFLATESLFLGRLDDYENDAPVLRPARFDNSPTDQANYNEKDIQWILHQFRAQRKTYIGHLEALRPEDFGKAILHPRLNRSMRLCDMLFFHAEHDQHHLTRISELKELWKVGEVPVEEIPVDKAYRVIYVKKPEESVWGFVGRSLDHYNAEQAGDPRAQRICFAVQGPEQKIVGGVVAAIHWDWLFVDLMWLQEDLRGRGYGSHLLTLVEDEARRRGGKHAYLDTFSFQAPDFYKQHGYRVFGELQDFPPGHRRYFLTKEL